MKNILLLCVIGLLSGCATVQPVPVKQKFPEAPNILLEKCPPLDKIESETILFSEFLKVVTNNYTKYHNCAKMIEAWQQWYVEQKDISNELNKSQ
jgi:hypothetical protein